jgi:hypothetical protein
VRFLRSSCVSGEAVASMSLLFRYALFYSVCKLNRVEWLWCVVWDGWSDVNECAATVFPPTCNNGGLCTNSAGNFTCDCFGTGYSGATCDAGELRRLLCVSCLPLVCRSRRSPVCAALVCCCLVVTFCFTLCVRVPCRMVVVRGFGVACQM